MRKALLALGCTLLAGSLQAQSIPSVPDHFRRTFTGCDALGSCVWLTMDMTQGVEYPEWYHGHISWRARFVAPAAIYVFGIDLYMAGYVGGQGAPFSMFETGFEGGLDFPNWDTTPDWELYYRETPWRPQQAWAYVWYSDGHPVDPDTGLELVIPLTLTPEPASLLLLATGLGAVAAGARRRRAAAKVDQR